MLHFRQEKGQLKSQIAQWRGRTFWLRLHWQVTRMVHARIDAQQN